MADTINKTCELCGEDYDGLYDGNSYCDLCNNLLNKHSRKDVIAMIIDGIIETKEEQCKNSGWNWLETLKRVASFY
jgi:phage/plasmid-associated DNA primase